jgi:hypothetical protein
MGRLRRRGPDLGSGCGNASVGLDVAGRRRRPPGVLGRQRQIRGRSTPGNRHRARGSEQRPGSGVRRDHIRRRGADLRPDRDDRGRRPQGFAHPSRSTPGQAWPVRRRRRADRCLGHVRRARARGAVRPSRDPARRGGRVRRPTRTASAAKCAQPSACAGGSVPTRSAGRTLAVPIRRRAAGCSCGTVRALARRGHVPAGDARGARVDLGRLQCYSRPQCDAGDLRRGCLEDERPPHEPGRFGAGGARWCTTNRRRHATSVGATRRISGSGCIRCPNGCNGHSPADAARLHNRAASVCPQRATTACRLRLEGRRRHGGPGQSADDAVGAHRARIPGGPPPTVASARCAPRPRVSCSRRGGTRRAWNGAEATTYHWRP